jgi:spore germination protein GerM
MTSATAIVLIFCGCVGCSSKSAAPDQATIYFLRDHATGPIGVRRAISGHAMPARQVMKALLAGPSAPERSGGVATAIPPGTRLLRLKFAGRERTDAVVDLSNLPRSQSAVVRLRVITQVARSLIGVSGIERAWLRSNGKPWGLWSMSGGIFDQAWSNENLGVNVCVGKPGTETIVAACFTPLS